MKSAASPWKGSDRTDQRQPSEPAKRNVGDVPGGPAGDQPTAWRQERDRPILRTRTEGAAMQHRHRVSSGRSDRGFTVLGVIFGGLFAMTAVAVVSVGVLLSKRHDENPHGY